MSTLFVENTPDVDAWLARRRELGLDGKDEIWEGVYHVTPYEHRRNTRTASRLQRLVQDAADAAGLEPVGPFNLGAPDDFRVPDLSLVSASEGDELYNPTAAVVVEVLSPRDETFAKFGFYAAHHVEEIWVVDPMARTVRIWQLDGAGAYAETGRSDLLDLTATSIQDQLDWPEG